MSQVFALARIPPVSVSSALTVRNSGHCLPRVSYGVYAFHVLSNAPPPPRSSPMTEAVIVGGVNMQSLYADRT